MGVMDGSALSPESIEQVLRHADYNALVKEMESRIHDAIPFGIGGDFETFTAPYGEFVEVGFLWLHASVLTIGCGRPVVLPASCAA